MLTVSFFSIFNNICHYFHYCYDLISLHTLILWSCQVLFQLRKSNTLIEIFWALPTFCEGWYNQIVIWLSLRKILVGPTLIFGYTNQKLMRAERQRKISYCWQKNWLPQPLAQPSSFFAGWFNQKWGSVQT